MSTTTAKRRVIAKDDKDPRAKGELGIQISVVKQGKSAGPEVIFTTAASNHYTSASFTADTCCSCAQ